MQVSSSAPEYAKSARAAHAKRKPGAAVVSIAVLAAIALICIIWLVTGHTAKEAEDAVLETADHIGLDVSDRKHPEETGNVSSKEMPYRDSIAEAAQEFDLDPYLVAAVIQTESGFDPNVGNGYACGLMGVSSIGCEEMNVQGVVDPAQYPPGNISDPHVNIHYGAAILRWFIDAYDDLPTALAAYNAGPSNADRWVSAAGGNNIVTVIDIPETSEYLKNVPANKEKLEAEYPNAF